MWLGTSLAGSLFGLLLVLTSFANEGFWAIFFGAALFGTILGLIIGFLVAGIVAVPVVLLMATASWAIGRKWWRVLLAIIAGGDTGDSLYVANRECRRPPVSLGSDWYCDRNCSAARGCGSLDRGNHVGKAGETGNVYDR